MRSFNLDTVLGAWGIGLLASVSSTVAMPLSWWISLGLSVWVVYTADRLLDVKKIGNTPQSKRHLFHKTHQKALTIFLVIVAAFTFSFSFFMLPTILFGLGIVLVALLSWHFYFLRFSAYGWLKEGVISFIYTAGIFMGPMILSPTFSTDTWGVFGAVFACVLLNLWVYAYFDFEDDSADGMGSIGLKLGKAGLKRLILSAWVAGSTWMSWQLFSVSMPVFWGYFFAWFIFFLTGLMVVYPVYFSKNERYRRIGEVLFWLPIALLWIR